MKYYLIQHGDGDDEDTLHEFDTPEAREKATSELIWDEPLECPADWEAWRNMKAELEEKGRLTFEGDPGLEWFHATPCPVCGPNVECQQFATKKNAETYARIRRTTESSMTATTLYVDTP